MSRIEVFPTRNIFHARIVSSRAFSRPETKASIARCRVCDPAALMGTLVHALSRLQQASHLSLKAKIEAQIFCLRATSKTDRALDKVIVNVGQGRTALRSRGLIWRVRFRSRGRARVTARGHQIGLAGEGLARQSPRDHARGVRLVVRPPVARSEVMAQDVAPPATACARDAKHWRDARRRVRGGEGGPH